MRNPSNLCRTTREKRPKLRVKKVIIAFPVVLKGLCPTSRGFRSKSQKPMGPIFSAFLTNFRISGVKKIFRMMI